MRQRIINRRPSPGVILGVIALVAALAGTAVASDPTATTSALSKKKVKKIANKRITKRAPDLAVASAVSADNATNADNADAVDGHSAVCPAGTFLHAGACFDSNERFDNIDWTGAAQACADAGGYLPIPSELLSIRNEPGINLGPPGDGSWADARYQDAGVNEAMTVVDNGTLEGVALAGPRELRCAFKLVR
jgi:hypothetical protein